MAQDFRKWIAAAAFIALGAAGATSSVWRGANLFGGGKPATFAGGDYSEPTQSGVRKGDGAAGSADDNRAAGPNKPVEQPGKAGAAAFRDGLREGATANPSEAERLLAEATKQAEGGNNWMAYDQAREAIRQGADDPAAWMVFADYAKRINYYDDAARAAQWALSASAEPGQKADILRFLGELYETMSEEGAAVEVYRASVDLRRDADISTRISRLTGARLYVNGQQINSDEDQPQICVDFSWELREDGSVQYENFIRTEGKRRIVAIPAGRSLCIEGYTHGDVAKLTLLSGLPAQGGATLGTNVDVTASLEDRPARLAFKDNAYILPRVRSAGVPLSAVNLNKAKLELFLINDRNLAPQFERGSGLNQLWGYDAKQIADSSGESVWKGSVSFENRRNRVTVAAIPLDTMMPERKPGIYVLTAQPDNANADDWTARATQWLIVTDIGLSVMSGETGVQAIARSYATAKPIAGVRMSLIARNNKVLGEALTDASGRARFAPGLSRGKGGNEPRMMLAYGKAGEFSFVDLAQPGFDLTDRGVGGRAAPANLDAFLYTDRGIYRPGEEAPVRLGVLLRDPAGRAANNPPPLTLRVYRPDGVEVERQVLQPNSNAVSAYFTDFRLPNSARTGQYSAAISIPGRDGQNDELSRISFEVEDFVPARLELRLTPQGAAFSGKTPLAVEADAQYLYGAAGSGLSAEANVSVRAADDPFPTYKGFRFGLVDENFEPVSEPITLNATNAQGKANFAVTLPQLAASARPLEAVVRATVFEEGGRPITRAFTAPILRTQPYIGLRVREGTVVPQGQVATLEAIAVDATGMRIASPVLRYRIVKEDWRYVWSQDGGDWRYRSIRRDRPVSAGAFQITKDAIATLPTPKLSDWGTYRIEIFDPREGGERRTAASIRVDSGWSFTHDGDETPDTLTVRADKEIYQAGDVARLLIKAPFTGEAELTLAREGVIESRNITLNDVDKGTVVSIPVRADWGPGVYAVVQAFRPGSGGTLPIADKSKPDSNPARFDALQGPNLPGRSIGLVWLGLDPAPRSLKVAFTLPAEVTPRQAINVPFQVQGESGGSAFVTVAAVDEGILQLTGFATPNPAQYFLGKRKLGVDLRDAYGKLIDPRWNVIGQVRSGGDAASRQSSQLPDRWIKPVALYSGVVKLDGRGNGSVKLDLPEFQGRLRLMAVAASKDRTGSGEGKLIVRDPVVVNGSPPRFLAPGDEAMLTLTFHNVSGPAGMAKAVLTGEGALSVDPITSPFAMKQGEKIVRLVRVTAKGVGPGRIKLAFTPPNGTARPDIVWPISVRPSAAVETRVTVTSLAPGARAALGANLMTPFYRNQANVSASFSTLPGLDLKGLANALDQYPYGCTEQTLSRALPLLYLSELRQAGGTNPAKKDEAANVAARLNDAIARIQQNQTAEGGFGLWSGSDAGSEWLTAYALEFLLRAQEQKLAVSDLAIRHAIDWLTSQVNSTDFGAPALNRRAYALYALARADQILQPATPYVTRGTIAYFADVYGPKLPNPLAKALLSGALSAAGDGDRATKYRNIAIGDVLAGRTGTEDWESYGGALRNLAGVVAIAAESRDVDDRQLRELGQKLSGARINATSLSTQEMAWMVRAAHALLARGGDLNMALDGKAWSGTSKERNLSFAGAELSQLDKGVVVVNQGSQPIFQTVSVTAIPKVAGGPASQGMRITRDFYRMNGLGLTGRDLQQNDLVVVVLNVTVTEAPSNEVLVVDLLPAGLEIENTRLLEGRIAEELSWLSGTIAPTHTEIRDDRYVAGVHTNGGSFKLAYLARAVSPGKYGMAGPYVEDMYRPALFGRGAAETITVTRK